RSRILRGLVQDRRPELYAPSWGGHRRTAAGRGRRSGSEQQEKDHVDPAENPVDDGPHDRVVVVVGDRDRQGRAEAGAVLGAFDPDPVGALPVHAALAGSGPFGRTSTLPLRPPRWASMSAAL